ncbi:hypothetical protein NLJ89_g5721 [Agrocybe chaxingu]|uniref:FAD-binding domain-containing protein n=1 Tax=Agrocybe chaxingu TaxID=84603 RepID=A0A9W8K0H3_9AGAR|nr:hypothetical protein NLJ89_g5721 [Agrocybe chaxingu]
MSNEETHIAPYSLNVVIVGGGVAGLSTAFCLGKAGHKITLVEGAEFLGEVGAGIQVAPNVSRLLIRWGLQDRLTELGVKPLSASFRRYENDEQVGFNIIGERFEQDHGSPYYHLHRADLVEMIYGIAKPFLTVKHAKVTSVSPGPSPSVTLESGEVIEADLVIGADGIKSVVRKAIVEGPDRPSPTGDVAYRALIPTDNFLEDPELRSLVENPQVTCWMGPGRHIVGYCVRGRKQYNLVMIRPDTESEESWVATADSNEVRETYKGWNSRVTKLVGFIQIAMKSKLVVRPPLDTWVDPSGRIALLGDSCHSMLPYLAQGAAMAIEDAAVLGNIFSRISHPSQIGSFLKAYQDLRLPRATGTQRASQANQLRFHLPDGPEQQARDAAMKEAMKETLLEASGGGSDGARSGNRSVIVDHNKQLASLQFDYDADTAVDEWREREGMKL